MNTSVLSLLRASGPMTIIRLIISIIIFSVDGVMWRWWKSHVGNELPKVTKPFLANRYPSPAIIMKVPISIVVASMNHASPSLKHRMSSWFQSCSNRISQTWKILFSQSPPVLYGETSTTFGITFSEITCCGNFSTTTHALAKPQSIFAFFGNLSNYSKSIKCRPNYQNISFLLMMSMISGCVGTPKETIATTAEIIREMRDQECRTVFLPVEYSAKNDTPETVKGNQESNLRRAAWCAESDARNTKKN